MARSRSSIFSFETLLGGGWRVPAGALTALVVVAGCELLLHALEPRLPEPVLWGGGEASIKVAQVQSRVRRGDGPIDILILGPSHASVGISPAAMLSAAPAFEGSIYNGALNGRMYPVLELMLEDVYWPALHPRMLVLTASPVVFNRYNTWMEQNTSEFFAAPMPKALSASWPARPWLCLLAEHVDLYRYRRREARLSEGFFNGRRVVDPFGHQAVEGMYDASERRRLGSPAHPYRQIMRRFEFGGPSAEAFVRILNWAGEHELPVVVVNTPFRPELLSISPTGPADYRDYLRHMHDLRAQYGFVWLDYQQRLELTDGEFRDVDHLNAAGSERLSRQLMWDLLSHD